MAKKLRNPSSVDAVYHPKGLFTSAKRIGVDRNMSVDQVQSLLDAASAESSIHGQRAYPLFVLLANFGPRISEALDLKVEDFKALDKEDFFDIRRLKKRGNKELNFMWVNQEEKALLVRLLEGFPKRGHLFGFGVRTAQYLFGHFCEKAGLRNVYSPHALRRFMSDTMAEAKILPWVISLRLGHNLDTTTGYVAVPTRERVLPELEKKPVIF